MLKRLKTEKSRDPHNLINEIFKPGVIGTDLKLSLLRMFNKIKSILDFPEFMEYLNIIPIYKGRGDRMDILNERGIFITNVFRSIFMKLVYNDKYDIVDEEMSDSKIFMINGVINEALNDKTKDVDIQIVDYKQCFDSMWLEEVINDMYETGVKDDNLVLLYKANEKNKVTIKTPGGETEEISLEKIILQGETFGSLQCSVQVDSIGKECLVEKKHLYQYKGSVGIPPLGMVDDLVCISSCGLPTTLMNAFLNAKTSIKKLQFGVDKCHKIHIGKNDIKCPELFIDNWKLVKKDNLKTGYENLEEVLGDEAPMEKVSFDKYLGDLISEDGSNDNKAFVRTRKLRHLTMIQLVLK